MAITLRTPTVFVPYRGMHDFSKAEAYGELQFILDGRIDSSQTGLIGSVIEKALTESHPDDYILVSGLPVVAGMTMAVFAAKHKRLNLLIYNGSSYAKREVVMPSAPAHPTS